MSPLDPAVDDAETAEIIGLRSGVVANIDSSPDEAARAFQLHRATGVPPSVIAGDLETFDRQHKQQLAAEIVQTNPHIRDYLAREPMASRLSNDDYGQLDTVSQATSKLVNDSMLRSVSAEIRDRPNAVSRGFITSLFQNPALMSKAMTAASHLGPEERRQDFRDFATYLDSWSRVAPDDYAAKNLEFSKLKGIDDVPSWLGENLGNAFGSALAPMIGAFGGAAIGAPLGGGVGAGIGAGIGAIGIGYPLAVGEVYGALVDAGVEEQRAARDAALAGILISALDAVSPALLIGNLVGLRQLKTQVATYVAKKIAITAAAEGATEGIQEMVKEGIVAADTGKDFATQETLLKVVDSTFSGLIGGTAFGAAGAAGAGRRPNISEKIDPWTREGREPPPFLDDDIDKLKVKQNDLDVKDLEDALSESEKSSTKARDPDVFAEFVRQHTDAKIGISGDVIALLYGDKVPSPDDNLLGWVPGIADQLESARATGADIHVPIADWLAKVDPALAKEIRDHIRVRPGGITKAEAEQIKEAEEFEPKVVGELPKAGVAPASIGADGKMYVGAKNTQHFELSQQHSETLRKGLQPGEGIWKKIGFVNPEGKFMDREQAFKWVEENEKAVQPSENMESGQLDALDYREQVPEAKRKLADTDISGRMRVTTSKPERIEPLFPQDSLRDAAGLEPMFQLANRKLTLKKATVTHPTAAERFISADVKNHDFEFVDQDGKAVGYIMIAENADGKELYVEDIAATLGERGDMFNMFGPRLIRDILMQIKEQFPDAKELRGYRVGGARDKAGTWLTHGDAMIKLDVFDDTRDYSLEFNDAIARWHDVSPRTAVDIPLPEALAPHERELNEAITAELNRLVPKGVHHAPVRAIKMDTENVQGLYAQYAERKPLLFWAFTANDPRSTARHEAIHHLRQYGFFSLNEWAELRRAAEEGGWIKGYSIDKKYSSSSYAQQIEESVAEAFGEWRSGRLEATGTLEKLFQRIQDLLQSIRHHVKEFLGRDLTAEEIFAAVERGQVGRREGNAPMLPTAFRESAQRRPVQLDLGQDLTRMEDREPFEAAAAIGMTVPQYKRYMKLIEKRNAEDAEYSKDKAIKEEVKRQSAEWKALEVPIREQVVKDIDARPDVMAINAFRHGQLHGQAINAPMKLDPETLSPEQRKQFPERWTSAVDGVHPDEFAPFFGFESGQAMVDAIINYHLNEIASAKRPIEYKRQIIQQEVTRRMEQQHGKLRENILAEVKDRVLSETQLDLLAEEVMALAPKDAEISISKADLKAWALADLEKQGLADVSSDQLLANAGKAGKLAELALLKGDPITAFREKQRQFLSIVQAKEMMKVEKEFDRFERTIKRFSQREVANVDQEFTDYIQSLMLAADLPGRRSGPELQGAVARHGYPTFERFVGAQFDRGWEPDVGVDIVSGNFPPLDKMTIGQFREFKAAVDSLEHIGRAVEKIEVGVEKVEFAQFKARALEAIRKGGIQEPGKLRSTLYGFDASLVKMEEVFKDLDQREELGPMWSAVFQPNVEAKSAETNMMTELANKLKSVRGDFGRKWMKSLDDTIPQDFLWDSRHERFFNLTRQGMINIMQNFGNRSNIEKFTKGWVHGRKDMDPKQLDAAASKLEIQLRMLFEKHANKEDWEYVQHMWDTFGDYQKLSNDLSYRVSGVAPKWIAAEPVRTKHGTFAGGYFPIIYDKGRSGIEEQVHTPTSAAALFTNNYTRATVPRGYTKERTGYIDFIAFENTLEQTAARLKQMIHDITHRESVMNASKVLYDKDISGAIKKYYGDDYADQSKIWLRDVANHMNLNEAAVGVWNNIGRGVRMNLLTHALGLNLRVILSPGLGKQFILDSLWNGTWNRAENRELAFAKSKEIPNTLRNMDRDFREQMERYIVREGWDEFKGKVAEWAVWPAFKIEEGLRINTFVKAYNDAREQGMTDEQASARADSILRERHGASGVVDLPAIMRHQNEMMKTLTLFYGYFNTTYNWQRQIPGQARRGEFKDMLGTIYGAVLVPAAFGALFFNEQKESDKWWQIMAKALILQPIQTIPGMRELGALVFEGHQPRTPWESLITAGKTAYKDIENYAKGKQIKKPVQHAANIIGLSMGLPLAQVGRTGQFLYDVNTGAQRPRTFAEYVRGFINGQARLKP